MEENYLVSVFLAFLFGFILFRKEKSASCYSETQTQSKQRSSEVSGVSKYLQNRQGDSQQLSSVSRYLASIEQTALEADQQPTGVAKYLAGKQVVETSGVSKYMAKKAIAEQDRARNNISSVEKYLKNRS